MQLFTSSVIRLLYKYVSPVTDMIHYIHRKSPNTHIDVSFFVRFQLMFHLRVSPDVINLSSDGDDDNIHVSGEATVEEEESEPSGAHSNDALNLPDARGMVLVNLNHPATEGDIFLSPQLARAVKPHQVSLMFQTTKPSERFFILSLVWILLPQSHTVMITFSKIVGAEFRFLDLFPVRNSLLSVIFPFSFNEISHLLFHHPRCLSLSTCLTSITVPLMF